MQLSEIIALARDLIDEPQNVATLTDTTITRFINARYDEVLNEVMNVNQDFFGAIDQTIDLVNGTDSYALPALDANSVTKIVRINRLEIAYDGTNFVTAQPIAEQKLPDTNFVSAVFTTQNPRYYLFGNNLRFLPTPTAAATDAVKIWYIERQTSMTGDSERPAFPEQYHYILAYGAAADIKMREGSRVVDTDDIPFVDRFENKYRDGLQKLIETIQPRDISTPVQVTSVRDFNNLTPENSVLPGSLTIS